MARGKKQTETDTSFNPEEFDRTLPAAVQEMAPQEQGHTATIERKQYARPADLFGVENIKGGGKRVQLLKSEGEGVWVFRFAHNPNQDKGLEGETYSKETMPTWPITSRHAGSCRNPPR